MTPVPGAGSDKRYGGGGTQGPTNSAPSGGSVMSSSGASYSAGDVQCASGSGMSAANTGTDAEPELFSKVVTRNGWGPPDNRKRKMSGTMGNSDNKRVLLGGRNAPNRDVMVLNLQYSECRNQEDLVELVKDYCRARGVGVVFIKVFTYDFDLTFANCRVTVKEFDVQKVLAKEFWPLRTSVRPWLSNIEYKQKQKENRIGEGVNGGNA